jgi:hypothetical protein
MVSLRHIIFVLALTVASCGGWPRSVPREQAAESAPPKTTPLWAGSIKSPKKRVQLSDRWRIATIEGRWRKVNPDMYYFTTPTINSVHISCGKEELTCTERIAWVYSITLDGERSGASQDGELFAITLEYEVREWSSDRILAVRDMPAATLELGMFPKTGTADRLYAEREDPKVFNRYVLE